MVQLSSKWADFFNSRPETGMGYVIVTVILKDGRCYPRVVVAGGMIAEINGDPTIPFSEDEIAEFVITHDKTDLLRKHPR